jgi:hypothetical protein
MDTLMIAPASTQSWPATPPSIRNPDRDAAAVRLKRHRAALVSAMAVMTDRLLPSGDGRRQRNRGRLPVRLLTALRVP